MENTKMESKQKWIEKEYHVQDNSYVAHKYFKMFCDTNQFPSLQFCDPNTKQHGVRGLIKHYHKLFDTKIGHGICTIFQINCACDGCTFMLEKPWVPALSPP